MRNAVKWTWFGAAGLVAGLLGACAHEKPATVAETKPAIVVIEAREKVEVEELVVVSEEDVGAELKAAVVHFDFDKAVLKPGGEEKLQQLADVLQRHPELAIQIQGNCDERGTEEYNLHLGQRRAFAAKQYLVNLGIDPNRVDTISYGFERPVDPGHNEKAWAANRRDDFVRTQKVSAR
jgi:peptidoglycan-associated lipoprotein